jgi:hypothetical protein
MTISLNISAPRRSSFAAPGFQRVDAQVTRRNRVTAVDSFVGATPSGPALDTARQLNPMNPNGRYWPRDGQTFCNFYTQDTLRARGVPDGDFVQRRANETHDWLKSPAAAQRGWRSVSADEAQRFVNGGGVGLAVNTNPDRNRSGHIAPIVEGQVVNGYPTISNAGSDNFLSGSAERSAAFRRAGTEYYVYDP